MHLKSTKKLLFKAAKVAKSFTSGDEAVQKAFLTRIYSDTYLRLISNIQFSIYGIYKLYVFSDSNLRVVLFRITIVSTSGESS